MYAVAHGRAARLVNPHEITMSATTPSPLFANHRQANLDSTTTMIEDVLVELGHFLNRSRDDQDGTIRSWKLSKGSADLRLSLIARDDFTYIRLTSPVMQLPTEVDPSPAYAYLLAQNLTMAGAAFGCIANQVVLITERSTLDLDRSELVSMLINVQNLADHHDDELVAMFGGTLGGAA